MVHELAHELLHRGDRREGTCRKVRETEAEATAFVVCHAIGLDTGSAACDYIQHWNGDVDTLTQSLTYVQKSRLADARSPSRPVNSLSSVHLLLRIRVQGYGRMCFIT
jgi:hypothetical protein